MALLGLLFAQSRNMDTPFSKAVRVMPRTWLNILILAYEWFKLRIVHFIINALNLRQVGRHFADGISKSIYLNLTEIIHNGASTNNLI